MAFNLQNFATVSSSANKNAPSVFSYSSTGETLATIAASAYFDSIASRLNVGDLILILGSDSERLYKVTAVSPDVTLSIFPSGLAAAYVPVFGGVRNFGGGGTSDVLTLAGVLATDVVLVTVQQATNACTLRCKPTTNTLTFTYSADPGASTVVSYAVLRAAT